MREVRRGARPKDIQDNYNLSGGIGEVSKTPRVSPPAYLYTSRFRVGEGLPTGQSPTRRLWASLDTSTCAVGGESGSVGLLSSQETSRFLISRGREKNGYLCPHHGEMLPVTVSHLRLSPPARAGSPFQIHQYPSLYHQCPLPVTSTWLHPYLFFSTLNLWLAEVLVVPGYSSPEPFANRSSTVQLLFFKMYFKFLHSWRHLHLSAFLTLSNSTDRGRLWLPFFGFYLVTLRLMLSKCSLDVIKQHSPSDCSNHMENSLLETILKSLPPRM